MPLLVISGVPGAGKTHYADHLERCGWIRIDNDEASGRSLNPRGELEALWLAAVGDSYGTKVAPFVQGADRAPLPVVLEFGFVMTQIGIIRALQQNGADTWWFTGDRAACLRDWCQAHPLAPEFVCLMQMDAIEAELQVIEATYGDQVVVTNPAEGRLTVEQINAAIGIDPDVVRA
jgi:hypothetical protein